MTTADLIAVMNAGRIEQLGTPQEVYDAPRSEFVARFLGGSNILRGRALDASRVAFAGTAVDCSGGPLVPGADVAVSVRQHDIAIAGTEPAIAGGSALWGRVVRNVFLGATRDYIVEAKDGTQLRVTATPEANFAPGSEVWLTLPGAACRALAG
jgi:iron(III) transport system ATP-binding protein